MKRKSVFALVLALLLLCSCGVSQTFFAVPKERQEQLVAYMNVGHYDGVTSWSMDVAQNGRFQKVEQKGGQELIVADSELEGPASRYNLQLTASQLQQMAEAVHAWLKENNPRLTDGYNVGYTALPRDIRRSQQQAAEDALNGFPRLSYSLGTGKVKLLEGEYQSETEYGLAGVNGMAKLAYHIYFVE